MHIFYVSRFHGQPAESSRHQTSHISKLLENVIYMKVLVQAVIYETV